MKEYQVNKIEETIEIRGQEKSAIWDKAEVVSDFCFPWNNESVPRTQFRALYNSVDFYFRFDVEDDQVLTFVDRDHKMEVVDSDRVEIFFRRDKQLNPYYCLEMDARGRVLDYIAKSYRDFDFEWCWPSQLSVKASETRTGYTVEGAIGLKSLQELSVLKENQIQAGLYRGFCTHLPEENKEAEFKWISWVIPETNKPDFHVPSSFGVLRLEE